MADILGDALGGSSSNDILNQALRPGKVASPATQAQTPPGSEPVPQAPESGGFLDRVFNEMRRDEAIASDAVPRAAAGMLGAPASFSNWANEKARQWLPKSIADVVADKPGFKSMPDIGAFNKTVDTLEGEYAPEPPQGLKENLIAGISQGLVLGPAAAGRMGIAKALQSGVGSGAGGAIAHTLFPKSEVAPIIGGIVGGGLPSAGSIEEGAAASKGGQLAQDILSPTTLDRSSRAAEDVLRGNVGKGERDTAVTNAKLEPFHKSVTSLSDQDKIDFVHYMQTRSTSEPGAPEFALPNEKPAPPKGGKELVPTGATKGDREYRIIPGRDMPAALKHLQGAADTVRKAYQLRETKLRNLDDYAEREFHKDYFAQSGIWERPEEAQKFADTFTGPGKEGAGAKSNLLRRKYPTIKDGLDAGLQLKAGFDPIEVTNNYAANMDRFIAIKQSLDDGHNNGDIRAVMPGKRPPGEGWEKLNTRLLPPKVAKLIRKGTPDTGEEPGRPDLMIMQQPQLYARKGFARVFNNFIDRGWYSTPLGGQVYGGLERMGGTVNGINLGLSGAHALNMAGQAFASQVANGVSDIMGGKLLKGTGKLLSSPAAPVTAARRGGRGLREYLAPGSDKDPRVRAIVEQGTKANMNVSRITRDLKGSAGDNYWKAFRRGTLGMELKSEFKGYGQGVPKAANTFFKQLGRVIDTTSHALFETYIPRLKLGTYMQTMGSWLEHNPEATEAETRQMSRNVWDSMDNRYGEVNHDNMFQAQRLKQVLRLVLRSYSYTGGTLRELGGGLKDTAAKPGSASFGAGAGYSPRSAYIIALPIAYGAMQAAYQAFKIGAMQGISKNMLPQSGQDLLAGRTGGTDVSTNQPERAEWLSDMKDVFGWTMNPRGEAWNKLHPMISLPIEMLENKDYRNDPIADPNADLPTWLVQWASHVAGNTMPLGITQTAQGAKRGSNISGVERFMGVHPASRYLTDPAGYERMMRNIYGSEWRKKLRHDAKQKSQYGGIE